LGEWVLDGVGVGVGYSNGGKELKGSGKVSTGSTGLCASTRAE
jgi:hypothetical protein